MIALQTITLCVVRHRNVYYLLSLFLDNQYILIYHHLSKKKMMIHFEASVLQKNPEEWFFGVHLNQIYLFHLWCIADSWIVPMLVDCYGLTEKHFFLCLKISDKRMVLLYWHTVKLHNRLSELYLQNQHLKFSYLIVITSETAANRYFSTLYLYTGEDFMPTPNGFNKIENIVLYLKKVSKIFKLITNLRTLGVKFNYSKLIDCW